jgi:phospho-N-acetylmuramoyl-pentapeptide-transferase
VLSAPLLLGLLTFVILVPWGPWVIDLLLRHHVGKNIRFDGPAGHQSKAGTATMGGLYFLAGITLVTALAALAGYTRALLPLGAMLAFGALGAYDDWKGLRDSQGVGWLARAKFPVQWALGFILAGLMYALSGAADTILPISGRAVSIGLWFVPIAAFIIVALANAVNLTDGLDGLAGGLAAIAYGAVGIILALDGQRDLALFCLAVAGALLAFLWFNVHPARLFMGDVGSEALGAGLAAVALYSGYWLLLPVAGIVFVAEALSVMLQVSYFKYTRKKYGEGRRVLRMAPLHHHFELGGWAETQVTMRFWIAGGLAALLALTLGVS